MKSQYNFFCDYLPRKCSNKNPMNPVIYIYDGNNLLATYSFDPIKDVLYVSDYNQTKFYYMSLYQFRKEDWIIMDKDYYELIIKCKEYEAETIPF